MELCNTEHIGPSSEVCTVHKMFTIVHDTERTGYVTHRSGSHTLCSVPRVPPRLTAMMVTVLVTVLLGIGNANNGNSDYPYKSLRLIVLYL